MLGRVDRPSLPHSLSHTHTPRHRRRDRHHSDCSQEEERDARAAAAAAAGGGKPATAGSRKRAAGQASPGGAGDRNPNLPWLEGAMRESHLVVDARLRGNVARFINHSCAPNCVVQAVMSGYCR